MTLHDLETLLAEQMERERVLHAQVPEMDESYFTARLSGIASFQQAIRIQLLKECVYEHH